MGSNPLDTVHALKTKLHELEVPDARVGNLATVVLIQTHEGTRSINAGPHWLEIGCVALGIEPELDDDELVIPTLVAPATFKGRFQPPEGDLVELRTPNQTISERHGVEVGLDKVADCVWEIATNKIALSQRRALLEINAILDVMTSEVPSTYLVV